MTPETLNKLEYAFRQGLSDRESCLYADISPQTLYNYCKEHPDYLDRKELLKEQVKMRAKENIAKAVDEGNLETSKWYTERKDKDFNPKLEHSGEITQKQFIITRDGTSPDKSVPAPSEPAEDNKPSSEV